MSYKYRVILAFVTLEIFFISLIVGVNFLTIDKNSQSYLDQRLTSTKSLISELIKAPLSVYDLATLDNIVQNIKKIENIKYVIISDSHDRLLSTNVDPKDLKNYHEVNERVQKQVGKETLVFEFKEIYNDNVLLGHMHLVFDITDTLATITKNQERTYIIILFQIMISTILAYIIGRQLTLKLNNLSDIASQIAIEQDTNVPYKKYNDELGYLASSMQKMQDAIIKRNEQLNLYAKVFESTQEAIMITDKEGVITHVNQAFCTISGFSQEEVVGSTSNILKSGNHTHTFYARMWESIIEKGLWNGEIINKRKNGQIYIALLNISAIYDDEGKIINFVAVSSDITQMKEKEKLMQLQSKMATMGEMLSNIAHQWRQPLSGITSAASSTLVQKEIGVLDDASLEKALKGVIASSEYLSKTIDDFRNYFKQDKRINTFNLNEMLKNDLTIIEAMLKNNYIKLILELDEEITISTYHNELIQVMMNIIHNSKDAMSKKKDEKLLFIKAAIIKDELELCIRDNGGGIDETIVEHIFEPYFTTKHQSQGTGIGLYMSHNMVVEHMKGRIKVQNVEFEYNKQMHKGVDFYIYLPLSLNQA